MDFLISSHIYNNYHIKSQAELLHLLHNLLKWVGHKLIQSILGQIRATWQSSLCIIKFIGHVIHINYSHVTRFKKIPPYTHTHNSKTHFHHKMIAVHINQQVRPLLVLKVAQAAFAVACFWGLSDIHECLDGLQMAPSRETVKPGIRNNRIAE